MAKRRQRRPHKTKRPPSPSLVPHPVPIDLPEIARLEEVVAQAERDITALEQPRPVGDRRWDERIGRAYAAMDRGEVFPKRNIRARIAEWRRRRRHRKLIAKLNRSVDAGTLVVAERTSAAMLAVVTERIARIAKSTAPPDEIASAIRLTEQVREDYRHYVDRFAKDRESASAQVIEWRRKSAVATEAGRPDLAGEANDVVKNWEKREQNAAVALASCDASLARLDDAIGQLCELAQRR